MSRFDEVVEKMEERRVQKKNEEWNAWLVNSLQTRTKEEVMRSLFELLVFPIGTKSILAEKQLTH